MSIFRARVRARPWVAVHLLLSMVVVHLPLSHYHCTGEKPDDEHGQQQMDIRARAGQGHGFFGHGHGLAYG